MQGEDVDGHEKNFGQKWSFKDWPIVGKTEQKQKPGFKFQVFLQNRPPLHSKRARELKFMLSVCVKLMRKCVWVCACVCGCESMRANVCKCVRMFVEESVWKSEWEGVFA